MIKNKKYKEIEYDNLVWKSIDNGYYIRYFDGDRIFLHRYIYEKEVGDIPYKFIVHHIDEDILNNDKSNLKTMSRKDHTSLHRSGFVESAESNRKRSIASSGKRNAMYGRHHTEECKRKMSIKMSKMFTGKGNPMYGKTMSEESRKKISDSLKKYHENKRNNK